jgi:cytochrome P450 family 110
MTTKIQTTVKSELPPTLKTPAIIGMVQSFLDPFGNLERLHKKYGEIFYGAKSSLTPPYVIFSNPKAIEKVFTADPDIFEASQRTLPIKALIGDKSVVLLDGIEHRRHRKLIMPPFHGERLKSYSQTMVDVTKEVISSWQEGQTIIIHDYIQEITMRVNMGAIFGLAQGEKYDYLKRIFMDWLDTFESPLNSSLLLFPALQKDIGGLTPWGKFLRQKQQIRDTLQTECVRRRSNSDFIGEDVFSLLLAARDEAGEPMSNLEIQDELMTMLFAGFDTTSNSLAWSFYWIHRLPEIGQKLETELNSLSENAEIMDIIKLPYLSAVVSETLRLNPLGLFVGRQLKEPFELMGYQFESGTSLFPSIYLTHHREDIYPEPKKFKPERFVEKQYSPYEYLPFGGGNRLCLGYAFALFEMKLVLATIMSQVKLELLDNRPLNCARRGFAFYPQGGVKMKVISNNLL